MRANATRPGGPVSLIRQFAVILTRVNWQDLFTWSLSCAAMREIRARTAFVAVALAADVLHTIIRGSSLPNLNPGPTPKESSVLVILGRWPPPCTTPSLPFQRDTLACLTKTGP